jgi:hypothetical protein
MTELEKLTACIEDGHVIARLRTNADLETFFANSRTGIADVIPGGLAGLRDQVTERGEAGMEAIRNYLLWDYIAKNISELYSSYELVRDMLEQQLDANRNKKD